MFSSDLTIIVPCFNEARTLELLLERLAGLDLGRHTKQVIVVDDASADDSRAIAERFSRGRNGWLLLTHPRNQGKGSCIRTALPHATGRYTVIQDADLEYEVQDIARLLARAYEDNRVVVFGSRNLRPNPVASQAYYWGGRLVTLVANALYGTRLTDEPTCYKLVATATLRQLGLRCQRFEFCPEVTAKLARLGHKPLEVPITYHPRSVAQGKKIRWRDGWQAVYTLLRYRWWKPAQ